MATTYTNIAGRVLETLYKLFHAEFGGAVSVFYTDAGTDRAPEWFEVRALRSDPVGEIHAFASVRRYTFEILYLAPKPSQAESEMEHQKSRLEMAARMERFLITYSCYTAGAVYYWHDGVCGVVDYAYPVPERGDDNLSAIRIEWSCVVNEAIS